MFLTVFRHLTELAYSESRVYDCVGGAREVTHETGKANVPSSIESCNIFVANGGRQRYYTWVFKVIAEACGQDQAEDIDIKDVVSGIMILEYSWNEIFYRDGLFDQSRLAELERWCP